MQLAQVNRATAADAGPELDEAVKNLFTFHPWSATQVADGEKVRDAIAEAYKAVILNVPSSPTRTRALNALVDARMLANAAITFKGEI